MARLLACADGNLTSSATWEVVDATSLLDSETGGTVVTTSYVQSSAFTPGAITIDGIALKLSNRTGTTGTISWSLALAGVTVAGTEVTINCSDLPAGVTTDLNGGWVLSKFTGVLLVVATAYTLQVKTSSASQVTLFRDGTAANWSRMLRTTTTAAPGAGDDMYICKEWTAAATGTARTVTMDSEADTDYGSAPTAANSLTSPGMGISNGGTLTFGTTSAKNYLFRLSNSAIVYAGGLLNTGTVATPMPRDSSSKLRFDCGADGDYGLTVRNLGAFVGQGLSRTAAKLIDRCKLNTDEAVNSTSLGVDADTGWLDNDAIAVATTTRTGSQCEAGALNGNAGASDLTVDGFAGAGGGLAFAHSGTSPTQAEVALLTRNVVIEAVTSTLVAYVYIKPTATVDLDWVEFRYLGENATGKRGIEIETSTGSFNMQRCSVHDCEDQGIYLSGSTINNITIQNNVFYLLASVSGPGAQISTAVTATTITIDTNLLIRTGNGNGWTLADVGITFTNNTVAGSASIGVSLGEINAVLGTISGNIVHGCASVGWQNGNNVSGPISTLTSWRNSNSGFDNAAAAVVTMDGYVAFGNTTQNVNVSAGKVWLTTPTLNGDTTFATTNAITLASSGTGTVIVDSGDIGVVAGIKTAQTNFINVGAGAVFSVLVRSTNYATEVPVLNPSNLAPGSYIGIESQDDAAGVHRTYQRYGNVETDTTIFNTASPSMRMTPNNASFKLESAPPPPTNHGILVPVASGGTVTISVYTRKSVVGDGAAYNGAQPRLILRANPAIGIASDTVIATASVAAGSWGQISGTTATANDDGNMEFIVDCDGTAGWVNVDDWASTASVNPGALKYWYNGLPGIGLIAPSSGGGFSFGAMT